MSWPRRTADPLVSIEASFLVRHADVTAEHQIAALPSAEQQEKNRDQGQRQSIGNDRRRPLLIANKEIETFDQDEQHIRPRMPPGRRELTDLLVAEDVDDAHYGCKRRHHQTGSQQPRCCGGPCFTTCLPIDQIADECADEKCNRERNQHRVDGMTGYNRRAARIGHDSLQIAQECFVNTPALRKFHRSKATRGLPMSLAEK